MIRIVDSTGKSLEDSVQSRLHQILSHLDNTGPIIQNGLLWTVKNHFQTIYPGSQHYNPDKVTPKDANNGKNPSAEITIDVPGVTRAYHDLTIRPKFRKHLTIPMHQQAYGKKASDFDKTFVVKKKDGKSFIVQKQGGQLVFLFYLAKSAFQRRDSRLMPSDDTLCQNICSRITAYLSSIK